MRLFSLSIMLLLVCSLLLTACAAGSQKYEKREDRANFLDGIWHGWIAPVALVVHFFNHNIRIYETNNSGWTYDLGFYIAVVGGFGSFAFSRKKCKKS